MKKLFNENLIQAFWESHFLADRELFTSNGKTVRIIFPGYRNADQGPDFYQACVNIGGVVWYGPVEIHYFTSDFYKHGHHLDPRYADLVLHVVMLHDADFSGDVLELNSLLPEISDFAVRQSREAEIYTQHPSPELLEELLNRRIRSRSEMVIAQMNTHGWDWNASLAAAIIRYGMSPLNRSAADALTKSLPYRIWSKQLSNPVDLRGLFNGVAGFRQADPESEKQFNFYRSKYNLKQIPEKLWVYFRMRPRAFPGRRMEDLVTFFCSNRWEQFKYLWNESEAEQFVRFFWKRNQKKEAWMLQVLINALAIHLAAYDRHWGKSNYCGRAYQLLKGLPAENNKVTRKWRHAGMMLRDAADSQAILEWEIQMKEKVLNN